MNAYLSLLKIRPGFRTLWLASVVSLMGDWFNTIASVVIVQRYTDSGLAVGWILIARTLPRFFLGPVAGVVADRFDRVRVMVVSDLLRAGIVMAFLLVDRPERVWLIYALTAAQFIVASFFDPASSAILPGLLNDSDELLKANVLRSTTWSVMLALGSALGGGFAALFGVEAALIADAITFMVSAALVLGIGRAGDQPAAGLSTNGWVDFLDGFRCVVRQPGVAMLVLVKSLGQIGNGDIIAAVYAERFYAQGGEGAGAFGLMLAAAGAGAALGPVIGSLLMDEKPASLRKAILAGYVLIPLGWWVVGAALPLWAVCLGFFIRVMGASINWTYSDVLIQYQVPNRFLGRIFALDLGLFTLVSSAAMWLSGYLLDSGGIDPRGLAMWFAFGSVPPILLWGLFTWRRKT